MRSFHIVNGGVLCQNGDAALPLQIAGVHDPVLGCLVFTVNAALLQQLVHQRGLAMVNVGNDGNITDFLLCSHLYYLLYEC